MQAAWAHEIVSWLSECGIYMVAIEVGLLFAQRIAAGVDMLFLAV